MNIVTTNPDVRSLEKSFLNKSYASGVGSIQVKNTNKFLDNGIILIGEMGRERSELASINGAPTTTTITLDAVTTWPHDADDPVYVLDWNKIRIYRSTNGENGTYSLLATIDIDVDNEDSKTYYDDPNALTTYFYETSYYDSVGGIESERSQPIAATGYTEKQIGTIIAAVARKVKDENFIEMSLEGYIDAMNDINDDLITQAKRPYRFLKESVLLTANADSSVIPFPVDLWKINYLELNDLYTVTRPKKVSPTEARFQLKSYSTTGDYVDGIAYDDETNELIFYPAARTERIGAFNLHYYKKFTRFTSLADVVQIPNTLIYKLGLLREYYTGKADDDDKYLKKASGYEKRYNTEVMKLQREKNIEAAGPEGLGPDKKRYLQWGGRAYRQ